AVQVRMPGPGSQVGEVVGGEPLLGHALELEEQHVPGLLALGEAGLAERDRVTHRQGGQAGHPLGSEGGGRPRQGRAPVVAHDVGLLGTDVVEHGEGVARQLEQPVGLHRLGLVAVAEAPEVGGDRPVAGRVEGRHHAAPEVARVGPSVQQQHGRAVTALVELDPDPVRRDAHACSSSFAGGLTLPQSGRDRCRAPAVRYKRVARGAGGEAMEFNLADLFEHAVDTWPEREYLVADGRRRTYAEMDERANRLAHHLADHGIGPGDHVGIYGLNSVEWIESLWAVFKLRAVWININYRYVEDELAYLFAN